MHLLQDLARVLDALIVLDRVKSLQTHVVIIIVVGRRGKVVGLHVVKKNSFVSGSNARCLYIFEKKTRFRSSP